MRGGHLGNHNLPFLFDFTNPLPLFLGSPPRPTTYPQIFAYLRVVVFEGTQIKTSREDCIYTGGYSIGVCKYLGKDL